MGDMADDMRDGTTCSVCGLYFATGPDDNPEIYTHGHPAACDDCWEPSMKADGIQKTRVGTL